MSIHTEEELLIKAKVFDLDSLGLIYDKYSPGIYRYALRLLGEENLAEDCVADTFSRFLKTLRTGHGPEMHLQAYLYRIAHNWITDSYRRNPFKTIELDETVQSDENFRPEFIADQNIENQQVRNALQALTPDQRQVICLRFIEGWQNEQVAEVLDRPIGAVKALQHRALETLRRLLSINEKVSGHGSKE